MNKKIVLIQLIPILFAFFVMGFVDVVGISTSYVKEDFDLSDTLSNLLPMMVFIWFAVCSLPTGLIMNRIGRKNMVLISIAITLLAMLLPVFEYSYVIVLMSFVLLGIGNTILQVSLNPLLLDVVSEDKVASMLTLGQFIKAISSMLGPVIATLAVSLFGDWHLIFGVYAFVSLLSGLWLIFTPIKEKNIVSENSSFAQVLSLLKEREMIMSFSVILLIVGFEIGLMTAVPKYFAERCSLPISEGSLGCSVYFAARMLGTFILAKYSPSKFLMWNMIVAIVALAVFLMLSHIMTMMFLLFVIGFTCANVFPIIFSEAIKSRSDKANEVSSLMIMGVAGGAILPFIMGVVADNYNQCVSILVPLFALIYILFVSFVLKKKV